MEGRTLGAKDEFGTLRVILSTRQETPGCVTLMLSPTLGFSHTGREVRDNLLGSPMPVEPLILHLPGQPIPTELAGASLQPHSPPPIIPLALTHVGPPKGTGLA